jgi:glycosyltransferase involved in cell wall biosynthesis
MTPEPWPECTIVIPAYNEESRIGRLLTSLSQFPGRVIVVCDGNDRTADSVETYAQGHPGLRVRCLRFSGRLGKGGGVREGLLASDTELVGFMDADSSTPLEEMRMLFGKLTEVDCAIGSRWVPGASVPVQQDLLRRLESRIFNLIIRTLFGLQYRDTQCGAKVFRRSAVSAVLPDILSQGFEFDVELLWRLKIRGYSIGEYPIRWENRMDSRVKAGDILKMLAGLVTIRLRG